MVAAAAIHAAMTKEEVRAAIGWVGVIILSPIISALLYAIAGINRISAGRLFEIARVLSVPVAYLFEGVDGSDDGTSHAPRERMCLELARNFSQIPNERHQEALSQLARVLATHH